MPCKHAEGIVKVRCDLKPEDCADILLGLDYSLSTKWQVIRLNFSADLSSECVWGHISAQANRVTHVFAASPRRSWIHQWAGRPLAAVSALGLAVDLALLLVLLIAPSDRHFKQCVMGIWERQHTGKTLSSHKNNIVFIQYSMKECYRQTDNRWIDW